MSARKFLIYSLTPHHLYRSADEGAWDIVEIDGSRSGSRNLEEIPTTALQYDLISSSLIREAAEFAVILFTMSHRIYQPSNKGNLRIERAGITRGDYRSRHLFVQEAETAGEIDARVRADWDGDTPNTGASSAYLSVWRKCL